MSSEAGVDLGHFLMSLLQPPRGQSSFLSVVILICSPPITQLTRFDENLVVAWVAKAVPVKPVVWMRWEWDGKTDVTVPTPSLLL